MYCRKCGREIQGKAEYCPYCGEVQNKQKRNVLNKRKYLLFIVAGGIVVLMIGFYFYQKKLNAISSEAITEYDENAADLETETEDFSESVTETLDNKSVEETEKDIPLNVIEMQTDINHYLSMFGEKYGITNFDTTQIDWAQAIAFAACYLSERDIDATEAVEYDGGYYEIFTLEELNDVMKEFFDISITSAEAAQFHDGQIKYIDKKIGVSQKMG